MSRFMNRKYRDLTEYVPGEQPQDRQYIKLNTNESPFPPSDGVIQAITKEAIADLRLYSDPESRALKAKLASANGVLPENIFVSNGSDDILNFAFMAFGEDGAAFPDISYGFYSVFADLNHVRTDVIPLREDFAVNPADYCGRRELVVLANPNAPTGIALSVAEIEKIVSANPDHIVLVDEAYVDFGAESCCSLTGKYRNLLVVQTYSKSRSMAGARLGFAIADRQIIADLEKIKYSTNPYNINRLTQLAGIAAQNDGAYYAENCRTIAATRAYVTEELKKLGFSVTDSKANFVFAKSDRIGGGELYRKLKERGILIRHFDQARIADYNRITVGSREEMDIFLQNVREIIGE